MKKVKNFLIIALLFILLITYWMSFSKFGNKEKTIVNQPVSTTVTTRPRLEDDFYEYVNYEYLSEDKLGDDEIIDYETDQTDKIEEEKEIIIDELLESNTTIGTKIKNFYESYLENTEELAIEELNKYIDKMKSSNSIEEFVENAIEVNYELSTDILFAPDVLWNWKGESKKYFGLDLITYDWDNTFRNLFNFRI